MSLQLYSLVSGISWGEVAAVAGAIYLTHAIVKHEFQSPLAKLPGPRPIILASIVTTIKRLFSEDRSKVIDIHKKYGPIIRTGRTTVWISDATMIRKILSSHNYNKSPNYDVFNFDGDNLFATRNIDYHRVQKRLMLPAYTPKALNDLEPLLYDKGISRLSDRLRAHAMPDVIGEIGFGKSFDLLLSTHQHQHQHPIMEWMEKSTGLGVKVGKTNTWPTIHPSFFADKVKAQKSLLDFAAQAVTERRKLGNSDRKDTLQQLIDAVDEETGAKMSDKDLVAEAILLMTMHQLIENPKAMKQLVEEIKTAYPDPTTKVDHDTVRHLPYLEAVLHESMRLRPILPQGLSRIVPKEGITLGGYFLPAGTYVYSSVQTMHMNKEVFPDPAAFKPERWLTTAEQLTTMKQHWMPFSVGPRACLGRNLAWMELRLVTVELVRHFTFTALEMI
ncbi:cytochrome P450 [Syncephalis fuscata]|nr:cytochrome P450 [Syncephalis fuscata]